MLLFYPSDNALSNVQHFHLLHGDLYVLLVNLLHGDLDVLLVHLLHGDLDVLLVHLLHGDLDVLLVLSTPSLEFIWTQAGHT